ncbi:MAG: thiamine phosphate synthase [Helicobacteraceae bacterium]|nr:thiamine phosphate synthase [Helicobacteraceae bacterium]
MSLNIKGICLKQHSVSLRGLCAITDAPIGSLETFAQEALRGGASIVQLRDKHSNLAALWQVVPILKRLCDRHGALLIINDNVDLAKAAHGAHLGKEDMPIGAARSILGHEAIIGISCYGDLNRAKEAQNAGADYVAFGACFASRTKPNASVIDLAVISAAKQALKIPVCAIGGITIDNAARVIASGADMIAVIGALKADPFASASSFSALFNANKIAKE